MPRDPEVRPMEGKVCIVTGATSGIGRATAMGLARLGAKLLLVGRDVPRGEAALAAVRAQGAHVETAFLAADVSSQASVRQLAEQIRARYPRRFF